MLIPSQQNQATYGGARGGVPATATLFYTGEVSGVQQVPVCPPVSFIYPHAAAA